MDSQENQPQKCVEGGYFLTNGYRNWTIEIDKLWHDFTRLISDTLLKGVTNYPPSLVTHSITIKTFKFNKNGAII